MYRRDSWLRTIVVGLVVGACAALAALPVGAQSPSTKTKATATALPEPLTHDSVRELVSRLSDEEVRKLLLQQLDRAAVPAKEKGDKGMSGMVGRNAAMMRARLEEFREAFDALPETFREVVAKLDEPDGPSVLPRLAALTGSVCFRLPTSRRGGCAGSRC